MKANNIKQLLIVLICSIGLYSSGNYMANMSYIETLLDGLNVMIFFTCFFPFLFTAFALVSKIFKNVHRFEHF